MGDPSRKDMHMYTYMSLDRRGGAQKDLIPMCMHAYESGSSWAQESKGQDHVMIFIRYAYGTTIVLSVLIK